VINTKLFTNIISWCGGSRRFV